MLEGLYFPHHALAECLGRQSGVFGLVGEGQQGERMDIKHAGKGLDLIQCGAFKVSFQRTEIGTTGDQRKILLGEAFGFAESVQG